MHDAVEYQPRINCELRQEVCGDCVTHWRKVISIRDHETSRGEFRVNFCPRCKLGFTDPYPTEETSHYLYDAKENSDFLEVGNGLIDYVKDLFGRAELARLAPRGRVRAILDFATGNGRYAVLATKMFPAARVDAVDYQLAPPLLLQRKGSNVNYYETTAFAEQREKYDIIYLRHALEHTHHPVQLVRFLSERLSPDGVLYIEVPNLDSGCAKIFGKYWKNYYVPRHIFHFTIDSLKETVMRAGLEAEVGRNEIPFMGNTLALLLGADRANFFIQCSGALLHPLQLIIEAIYRSSTCISVRCRHPKSIIQP